VHSESRHFQTASGSRGQAARLTGPRCPKEARHGQQKVACSIQAQGLNHCRHPRARPGPSLPFPLRFPLAFDGKLLGQVVRIFTDTVASWYRRRHTDRGLPAGEPGAVTVIQRANSDLRLNPHIHAIFLDGIYAPDREGARKARGVGRGRCGSEVPEGGDGRGQMFHPAPAPSQQEIEAIVGRASKRILRFLQRRGVITCSTR